MFIRYNETNKYWEYDASTAKSGEGPWLILPISAEQIYNLPVLTNVAFTDKPNVFTDWQKISATGAARLSLIQANAPVDNRQWLFQVTPDNGINGALVFGPLNDANSAWQAAGIGRFVINRDGQLYTPNAIHINTEANPSLYLMDSSQPANSRVWRIMNQSQFLRFYTQDDGETGHAVRMELDRAAGLKVIGALRQGLDPPNGTGLYAWFVEGSNHIRAQGGLYDLGRGTPIGYWTDFTPTVVGMTLNSNYMSQWTVIGKTLHINFYWNVTFVGNNPYFLIPNGFVTASYASCLVQSSSSPFPCWITMSPGNGHLVLYGTTQGTTMTAGTYNVSAQLCFSIQ